MKRLHFILIVLAVMLGCASAHAESWNIRADAVAVCTYNDYYHRWNGWSEWQRCEVYININSDNDKITIYSNEVQIYKIVSSGNGRYNSDGDYRVTYKFRDQDGDYGTMYILKRRDGSNQLYITFSNIQWVYNIDN